MLVSDPLGPDRLPRNTARAPARPGPNPQSELMTWPIRCGTAFGWPAEAHRWDRWNECHRMNGPLMLRRAACTHGIAFNVSAAYARRHSRRRLRISWPRAPWTSPENSRTALSRRARRSRDVREARQALPPAERRRFNPSTSRYSGGSIQTTRGRQQCRRTGTARRV